MRAAINKVFGPQHPVQRCRNHKILNVCDRLPEEQKDQVKAAMRASYKLEANGVDLDDNNGTCSPLPNNWKFDAFVTANLPCIG